MFPPLRFLGKPVRGRTHGKRKVARSAALGPRAKAKTASQENEPCPGQTLAQPRVPLRGEPSRDRNATLAARAAGRPPAAAGSCWCPACAARCCFSRRVFPSESGLLSGARAALSTAHLHFPSRRANWKEFHQRTAVFIPFS